MQSTMINTLRMTSTILLVRERAENSNPTEAATISLFSQSEPGGLLLSFSTCNWFISFDISCVCRCIRRCRTRKSYFISNRSNRRKRIPHIGATKLYFASKYPIKYISPSNIFQKDRTEKGRTSLKKKNFCIYWHNKHDSLKLRKIKNGKHSLDLVERKDSFLCSCYSLMKTGHQFGVMVGYLILNDLKEYLKRFSNPVGVTKKIWKSRHLPADHFQHL